VVVNWAVANFCNQKSKHRIPECNDIDFSHLECIKGPDILTPHP